MNFVKFDLKEKTLVCRNENLIPRVCCHYLKNKDKCLKHYEKNKNIVGFCECPYGFNTFFDKNNIYTCLIVKEEINSRLVENLKTKNQKLNDFSTFTHPRTNKSRLFGNKKKRKGMKNQAFPFCHISSV